MARTRLILALAALGTSIGAAPPPSDPLTTLVEAERACARLSVEKGARASFLANFTDDGVWFAPEPAKAREALSAGPEAARRSTLTLDWAPVYADVSDTGDLGYTTGPYVLRDDKGKRPSREGYYLSIWSRPADGPWKVVLHQRTLTPSPAPRPEFGTRAKPKAAAVAPKRADEARQELIVEELALSAACQQGDFAAAYAWRLDLDARLHREGDKPLLGRDAIRKFLAGTLKLMVWQPRATQASEGGDLGYSYGPYDATTVAGKAERGYFVHVWRRGSSGWSIVASILKPLPPESAPAPQAVAQPEP